MANHSFAAAAFYQISGFLRGFTPVQPPFRGMIDLPKISEVMKNMKTLLEKPESQAVTVEVNTCVIRSFIHRLNDGKIVIGAKWYSANSEENAFQTDKRKVLKTVAFEIVEDGDLKPFDGEIVLSGD